MLTERRAWYAESQTSPQTFFLFPSIFQPRRACLPDFGLASAHITTSMSGTYSSSLHTVCGPSFSRSHRRKGFCTDLFHLRQAVLPSGVASTMEDWEHTLTTQFSAYQLLRELLENKATKPGRKSTAAAGMIQLVLAGSAEQHEELETSFTRWSEPFVIAVLRQCAWNRCVRQ